MRTTTEENEVPRCSDCGRPGPRYVGIGRPNRSGWLDITRHCGPDDSECRAIRRRRTFRVVDGGLGAANAA